MATVNLLFCDPIDAFIEEMLSYFTSITLLCVFMVLAYVYHARSDTQPLYQASAIYPVAYGGK